MLKKNKVTHRKENHNNINITSSGDTQLLILEQLMEINKSIGKVLSKIDDHEVRISKLEGRG